MASDVTGTLSRRALLGGALGLAACGPVSIGGGGPQIDASAPVPVALLVPRGSGQAQDDLLAKNLENAARLAMSDLSGVTVDLRVYDTQANGNQAAAVAVKAVDEGAKILLGPLYAQTTNAAALAVRSRGVNVLSFSNNPAIAGGNVFVLGNLFQNTADRLARYAVSTGRPSIYVVYANTPAETIGRDAILAAVPRAGGTVAGTSTFEPSQQAVVSAVPDIAAQIRASGAQAVFFTSDTEGAMAYLAQLLPENGIDPAVTQYIGLTRWDIPSSALSLPGLQGGWFATPDPATAQLFISRYAAAYGGAPHPLAGLAYDGIAAIGALVQTRGSDALTAAALTQPSGFVGVNGIFRLLPNGTNQRALAVAQIQNRSVVIIDPAPRSFGGAGL